jgi:hypothetical protein
MVCAHRVIGVEGLQMFGFDQAGTITSGDYCFSLTLKAPPNASSRYCTIVQRLTSVSAYCISILNTRQG